MPRIPARLCATCAKREPTCTTSIDGRTFWVCRECGDFARVEVEEDDEHLDSLGRRHRSRDARMAILRAIERNPRATAADLYIVLDVEESDGRHDRSARHATYQHIRSLVDDGYVCCERQRFGVVYWVAAAKKEAA